MYIEYSVKSTNTINEIIRDLSLVISGETDVSNLSASADTLVSIGTPDWVVYEDALDTTGVICLRAPISDDPSEYKYLLITEVSASRISIYSAYGWDLSTSTAIEPMGPSTYYYYYQLTTSANTYHMYSNDKCFFATTRGALIQGEGPYNSSYYGCTLIVEHTRDQPWQLVGAGYNPVCRLSTTAYYTYSTASLASVTGRTRKYNGLEAYSAPVAPMWVGGSVTYTQADMGDVWNNRGLTSTLYNTLGEEVHLFMPMWVGSGVSYAAPLGEWAYNCGLLFTAEAGIGELSTVSHKSVPYKAFLFMPTSTAKILVPQA